MALNSILEKVEFALMAAKDKKDDAETLSTLSALSKEHSNDLVLGRFFGFSVSDYAISALKWIGSESSNKLYSDITNTFSTERMSEIERLIGKELYKEV